MSGKDIPAEIQMHYGGSMECSGYVLAVWDSKNKDYKFGSSHWNIEFALGDILKKMRGCTSGKARRITDTLENLKAYCHNGAYSSFGKLIAQTIFILGDGLEFQCRYSTDLSKEYWIVSVNSLDYDNRDEKGFPKSKFEVIARHNSFIGSVKQALENINKGKVKSRDEYVNKVLFRNVPDKKDDDKKSQ